MGPLASPFALLFLVMVLFLMGFNVLREYERAVIFRWGRLARGLVGGTVPVSWSLSRSSTSCARQLAHGHDGRPASGRHHERQRHGQGERRHLFPGGGSTNGPSSKSKTTSTPLP